MVCFRWPLWSGLIRCLSVGIGLRRWSQWQAAFTLSTCPCESLTHVTSHGRQYTHGLCVCNNAWCLNSNYEAHHAVAVSADVTVRQIGIARCAGDQWIRTRSNRCCQHNQPDSCAVSMLPVLILLQVEPCRWSADSYDESPHLVQDTSITNALHIERIDW